MPPSATVKENTSSGVVEKLCQDPRVVTLPGWSGAQAFGRDIPSAKVIFYEPRLDCRSWLSQTGISLASGALRSWWIRLELSPVAPAILRILES